MQNAIVAFSGLGLFGFLMLWMGYRLGFNNGLATWQKSYRRMTPKDIEKHKIIINKMADRR